MRREFRKLYSWLLIAVMMFFILVVQMPLAKPAYAENLVDPNSTITPVTAVFDKNTTNQADMQITMTLNGNTLNSITNGGTALTAGSDYTAATDSSTVTIAKGYLAQQAIGTTTLNFIFSAGNPTY